MVRAGEKAMNILISAQRECEGLCLSAGGDTLDDSKTE